MKNYFSLSSNGDIFKYSPNHSLTIYLKHDELGSQSLHQFLCAFNGRISG